LAQNSTPIGLECVKSRQVNFTAALSAATSWQLNKNFLIF
jgi:hypothetical protein